jgi:3-deoxy-D-manno-octulosonic-acid transferase
MKFIAIGFLGVVIAVVFILLNPVLIYNIVISLYHSAIRIAAPFNGKAKQWVQGRKNVFLNLNNNFYYPDNKKIWIHCASLGEFEQGRPVIELLREKYPEHKILLTFFSPSGYEVQKDYAKVDYVCYLPAESKKNAQKFFEIVNPSLAVFVKYEYWVHYINVLHKHKRPAFLISAIFKKKMIFFKWYGGFFRKLLLKFTHIFVQEENSLELLKKRKIVNASVAHDTRYDRVLNIAAQQAENPLIKQFIAGYNVLVAGSTWHKDEKLISRAFYKNFIYNNFKLIIAPHQTDANTLRKTKKIFKKYATEYSSAGQLPDIDLEKRRILIIDNMGMLSALYRYADICYVGGGFKKGIHNILEAAVYGKVVFFGPNYKHAHEAEELIKIGSAFSINTSDEFIYNMQFLGNFQHVYKNACENAGAFVKNRCGGSQKVVETIAGYL